MNTKTVFGRFAQVIFAYGAAITVSSLFYTIIFWATAISTKPDKTLMILRQLPHYYVTTLMLVAAFAFPGWLIIMGLARGSIEKRMYFYMNAGAINASAVPAFIFLSYLMRGKITLELLATEGLELCLITIVMAVGGFLAGWVYWCVVKRNWWTRRAVT